MSPKLKDASDLLERNGRDAVRALVKSAVPVVSPKVSDPVNASRAAEDEAKPFPLHCLPPSAEAMARAIAKTERTPESLAGCCTLAMLSAAIGASLRIESGADRTTRGNLYIVASAESGSGKSETFRHAVAPFIEFETERVERWRASVLPSIAAEKEMLEAEMKRWRQAASKADTGNRAGIKAQLERIKAKLAEAESALHAPVFSVEDVTTERLAVMLSARGEVLASISADAGTIVNNLLGRYSKGDRTDESIYLKAFSGDYCRIDRQSREPVILREPCLAALWLVQPDKIESLLLTRSLTDGGLIPRILLCHTHAEPRPIVAGATGIPRPVSMAYRQTVRALLEAFRLNEEPRTIKPDEGALAVLNGHFNAIAERRLGELRDVTTFAARWNEQAWRIAVCLHAGLHGGNAHAHKLSEATAHDAIELVSWFAEQQLEILGEGRRVAQRTLFDRVLALLAEKPEGIKATHVYKARIVQPADAAHRLLARMEAEGELLGHDEPRPEGGGHAPRIYTRATR